MKNIFGAQVNTDQKEKLPTFDGNCFITARISDEHQKKMDSLNTATEAHEKKAAIPTWLNVIKYFCAFFGFCGLVGMLRADVSFEVGFKNAPAIYFIVPILLIASGAIFLFEKQKAKKYTESDALQQHIGDLAVAARESEKLLGIPQGAQSVDFLSFIYKMKKEKAVSAKPFNFLPLDLYIYKNGDQLCIADHTSVYSFPLSDLKEITEVKKNVSLACWNKDHDITSEKYKKYKMGTDQMGFVHIRSYFSLLIKSEHGEFELLIPPYDVEAVADIAGLRIIYAMK